jgi:ABC-type phosphate transport system substrate-binding protein
MSENDSDIVGAVASDLQALGYVGYGYFEQNRGALQARTSGTLFAGGPTTIGDLELLLAER